MPAVDRQNVYYLSKNHELMAVARDTGIERWRRRLNDADGHTQGIDVRLVGPLVIAGDGDLFAFDADTGRQQWRWPAGELVAPGRFVGDIINGALVVGSANGAVAAIDVGTGATRWQAQVASGDSLVLPEAAAPLEAGTLSTGTSSKGTFSNDGQPDRRVVYVAYSDFAAVPRHGGMVALDARDGTRRWTWSFPQVSSTPASAAGRPVRAGSRMFVAVTDGHVYGLDAVDGSAEAETGDVVWHRAPVRLPWLSGDGGDIRTLAAAPGRLVMSSLSGVLMACRLSQSGECWRFSSPTDGSNGFGVSVSVRRNLVFAPFASGRLGVVTLAAGQLVAMVSVPASRFDWAPVSADDQTFLVAEDGLYELRADVE